MNLEYHINEILSFFKENQIEMNFNIKMYLEDLKLYTGLSKKQIYPQNEELLIDIPGLNGYQASSFGRIYSKKNNKFLKPFVSNQGYFVVSICINNKVKKYSIHRLVAITFMPNTNQSLMVVNHLDGDRQNNHINNLKWATYSENNLHSYRTGRNKPNPQNLKRKI